MRLNKAFENRAVQKPFLRRLTHFTSFVTSMMVTNLNGDIFFCRSFDDNY